MNKRICNGLLLAFMGAIGLLSFSQCSKEGDILAPAELAPPTNFKAASGDARVFLAWTASPDAGSSDFAGYRIVTTTALGVAVDSTNAASTASSYTVFNLVNGGIYTFTIQSVRSNGSVSQKVTIQWGPTVRYGFQSLYEYESTEPSGLQFLPGQRFNFTIANKAVIDLWIDGRAGATPLLKSPDDFGTSSGWRRTLPIACAPLISDGPIILLVLLILSTVPPWLLLALQCAGGVFLLYLAYGAHRTWRTYATRREPATEGGQRSVLKAALGISLEDMDRSLGDCAGMFRGLPVLGGGACAPLGRASQRAPAH